MAYPLNQDVKKPYSLAFVDGYLKIQNGIAGSFCFLGTSVALLEGCNSVDTCNSELKRFVPDLLKVWGMDVSCCDNQLTSVALDPKNFGFDTAQELSDFINLTIKKGQTFGGEVVGKEQDTGYTVLGKPVYRQAFRVSSFVPGSGFTHNLDVDFYVKVFVASWENANPDDKREVGPKNDLGGQLFYYGTLLPSEFDEIITDTGFDELFIDLEYTKN